MKNQFGNLNGIPVYKVEKFDTNLCAQGFIQIIDNGDRYWKICTNAPIADGIYDSMTGNTSIYDRSEFNMGIKELKENAKRYREKKIETEVEVEVNDNALLAINGIIDEIMGKAKGTCEELLKAASQPLEVG